MSINCKIDGIDTNSLFSFDGPQVDESTAVIINASGTAAGIRAEFRHIESLCGARGIDWQLDMQRQQSGKGKEFDVITIRLMSGETRVFVFDITAFFGKH